MLQSAGNKSISALTQGNIEAGEAAQAMVLAEDIQLFADVKPVVGDVIVYLGDNWMRKIPRMYEALLDAYATPPRLIAIHPIAGDDDRNGRR